jgi:hypothetical protein
MERKIIYYIFHKNNFNDNYIPIILYFSLSSGKLAMLKDISFHFFLIFSN